MELWVKGSHAKNWMHCDLVIIGKFSKCNIQLKMEIFYNSVWVLYFYCSFFHVKYFSDQRCLQRSNLIWLLPWHPHDCSFFLSIFISLSALSYSQYRGTIEILWQVFNLIFVYLLLFNVRSCPWQIFLCVQVPK